MLGALKEAASPALGSGLTLLRDELFLAVSCVASLPSGRDTGYRDVRESIMRGIEALSIALAGLHCMQERRRVENGLSAFGQVTGDANGQYIPRLRGKGVSE